VNIDLFLTGQSEASLVCGGVFKTPLVGVILDAQTHEVTLEFGDETTEHLNIPMEEQHKEKLLFAHRLFVGYLEDGFLMDSIEVPLLYLNDPYGSQFGDKSPLSKPVRSVLAFEQFMKRCKFAQALHRDNLGDEDSAKSVLMGTDPHALKYSPTLQRQLQMNAAPKTRAAPQTPSLGGGSVATTQTKPATKKDDGGEDKK
jgi:hypothetical protein